MSETNRLDRYHAPRSHNTARLITAGLFGAGAIIGAAKLSDAVEGQANEMGEVRDAFVAPKAVDTHNIEVQDLDSQKPQNVIVHVGKG